MLESSLPNDITLKGSCDVRVDNEWKAKEKFPVIALFVSIKQI